MKEFEIALCFTAGIILVFSLCFVFSIKWKGALKLLFNSLCGGVFIALCSLTGVLTLPLNPLNALITGLLGLPGVILIILTLYFL